MKKDDQNVIFFFKENGKYLVADAHGGTNDCTFFMNVTNFEDALNSYKDDGHFLFIILMEKKLF